MIDDAKDSGTEATHSDEPALVRFARYASPFQCVDVAVAFRHEALVAHVTTQLDEPVSAVSESYILVDSRPVDPKVGRSPRTGGIGIQGTACLGALQVLCPKAAAWSRP